MSCGKFTRWDHTAEVHVSPTLGQNHESVIWMFPPQMGPQGHEQII